MVFNEDSKSLVRLGKKAKRRVRWRDLWRVRSQTLARYLSHKHRHTFSILSRHGEEGITHGFHISLCRLEQFEVGFADHGCKGEVQFCVNKTEKENIGKGSAALSHRSMTWSREDFLSVPKKGGCQEKQQLRTLTNTHSRASPEYKKIGFRVVTQPTLCYEFIRLAVHVLVAVKRQGAHRYSKPAGMV